MAATGARGTADPGTVVRSGCGGPRPSKAAGAFDRRTWRLIGYRVTRSALSFVAIGSLASTFLLLSAFGAGSPGEPASASEAHPARGPEAAAAPGGDGRPARPPGSGGGAGDRWGRLWPFSGEAPWWWPPPGPPYALDLVPRFLEAGRTTPECPYDALVRHPGTHLRYQGRARVHQAFVPRLERFEALVVELATDHYGRPPRRLVHRGAFNCRKARGRRRRVSEHALGNALDLRGFDFGALPRGETLPEGLPRRLRWGFRVRVASHWAPRHRRDAIHAAFLHRLALRLRASPEIFRGIVGPPRPRHHDHLHLDVAPWRYALFRVPPSEELER